MLGRPTQIKPNCRHVVAFPWYGYVKQLFEGLKKQPRQLLKDNLGMSFDYKYSKTEPLQGFDSRIKNTSILLYFYFYLSI